jgi:PAS domain S-box-containing protein
MASSKDQKKRAMRDIVIGLHRGLSVEEARDRFMEEVGSVSSTEIADIEQSLIEEGLSPDEIRKFCNVHALLFESALKQTVSSGESPSHPVSLFKRENRAIEEVIASIETLLHSPSPAASFREEMRGLLSRLEGIDIHYTRKEAILFPYLERHGFFGPTSVMWGKDDEIRGMLKEAVNGVDMIESGREVQRVCAELIPPLLEEVRGMIFKEESILFPTALDKIPVEEWVNVFRESEEVGYAFIERPRETLDLTEDLRRVLTEVPVGDGFAVSMPTGRLTLEQLVGMLNTLPVDITFVDNENRVRYYSEGGKRIFLRTKSVLGREVKNCHPPGSVEIVERILKSLKSGSRDHADFWIQREGRTVYIRYFAVRSGTGAYLGTLEVTQDITDIRTLEGERRIFDEAGSP